MMTLKALTLTVLTWTQMVDRSYAVTGATEEFSQRLHVGSDFHKSGHIQNFDFSDLFHDKQPSEQSVRESKSLTGDSDGFSSFDGFPQGFGPRDRFGRWQTDEQPESGKPLEPSGSFHEGSSVYASESEVEPREQDFHIPSEFQGFNEPVPEPESLRQAERGFMLPSDFNLPGPLPESTESISGPQFRVPSQFRNNDPVPEPEALSNPGGFMVPRELSGGDNLNGQKTDLSAPFGSNSDFLDLLGNSNEEAFGEGDYGQKLEHSPDGFDRKKRNPSFTSFEGSSRGPKQADKFTLQDEIDIVKNYQKKQAEKIRLTPDLTSKFRSESSEGLEFGSKFQFEPPTIDSQFKEGPKDDISGSLDSYKGNYQNIEFKSVKSDPYSPSGAKEFFPPRGEDSYSPLSSKEFFPSEDEDLYSPQSSKEFFPPRGEDPYSPPSSNHFFKSLNSEDVDPYSPSSSKEFFKSAKSEDVDPYSPSSAEKFFVPRGEDHYSPQSSKTFFPSEDLDHYSPQSSKEIFPSKYVAPYTPHSEEPPHSTSSFDTFNFGPRHQFEPPRSVNQGSTKPKREQPSFYAPQESQSNFDRPSSFSSSEASKGNQAFGDFESNFGPRFGFKSQAREFLAEEQPEEYDEPKTTKDPYDPPSYDTFAPEFDPQENPASFQEFNRPKRFNKSPSQSNDFTAGFDSTSVFGGSSIGLPPPSYNLAPKPTAALAVGDDGRSDDDYDRTDFSQNFPSPYFQDGFQRPQTTETREESLSSQMAHQPSPGLFSSFERESSPPFPSYADSDFNDDQGQYSEAYESTPKSYESKLIDLRGKIFGNQKFDKSGFAEKTDLDLNIERRQDTVNGYFAQVDNPKESSSNTKVADEGFGAANPVDFKFSQFAGYPGFPEGLSSETSLDAKVREPVKDEIPLNLAYDYEEPFERQDEMSKMPLEGPNQPDQAKSETPDVKAGFEFADYQSAYPSYNYESEEQPEEYMEELEAVPKTTEKSSTRKKFSPMPAKKSFSHQDVKSEKFHSVDAAFDASAPFADPTPEPELSTVPPTLDYPNTKFVAPTPEEGFKPIGGTTKILENVFDKTETSTPLPPTTFEYSPPTFREPITASLTKSETSHSSPPFKATKVAKPTKGPVYYKPFKQAASVPQQSVVEDEAPKADTPMSLQGPRPNQALFARPQTRVGQRPQRLHFPNRPLNQIRPQLNRSQPPRNKRQNNRIKNPGVSKQQLAQHLRTQQHKQQLQLQNPQPAVPQGPHRQRINQNQRLNTLLRLNLPKRRPNGQIRAQLPGGLTFQWPPKTPKQGPVVKNMAKTFKKVSELINPKDRADRMPKASFEQVTAVLLPYMAGAVAGSPFVAGVF